MRSQEGRPVYFHIQQALPLHTLLLLYQFDCRAIVAPASASSHSFILLLLLLRLLRINSTTKAAICFHLSEKEDAVDAARASSQELNQASFVCVCVCVLSEVKEPFGACHIPYWYCYLLSSSTLFMLLLNLIEIKTLCPKIPFMKHFDELSRRIRKSAIGFREWDI